MEPHESSPRESAGSIKSSKQGKRGREAWQERLAKIGAQKRAKRRRRMTAKETDNAASPSDGIEAVMESHAEPSPSSPGVRGDVAVPVPSGEHVRYDEASSKSTASAEYTAPVLGQVIAGQPAPISAPPSTARSDVVDPPDFRAVVSVLNDIAMRMASMTQTPRKVTGTMPAKSATEIEGSYELVSLRVATLSRRMPHMCAN